MDIGGNIMWWFQAFWKDPRIGGWATYEYDYKGSFNRYFGEDSYAQVAFDQDCVMWAWPIHHLVSENMLYVPKKGQDSSFYTNRYMYESDNYECNDQGIRLKSKDFPYSCIFLDMLDPLALISSTRQIFDVKYDQTFYEPIRKPDTSFIGRLTGHVLLMFTFRIFIRLEYWIWYIFHVAWFLFHWICVRFWMWGPQAYVIVLLYWVYLITEKMMMAMNLYSFISRMKQEHDEEKRLVRKDREDRQKKEWNYEHSVEYVDRRTFERMRNANEPYPESWKVKIGSGSYTNTNTNNIKFK